MPRINAASTIQRLKVIFLFTLPITMGAGSGTTLEEQFRGIEVCRIKNIFLDPVTHKPSGRYFTERKLEPCSSDEAAFYCVSDTFYGLTVSQIAIPYRGPFSVHAIYLKENPVIAEAAIRKQFNGIRLNKNDSASPTLIDNPGQRGSSVFYCDEYNE